MFVSVDVDNQKIIRISGDIDHATLTVFEDLLPQSLNNSPRQVLLDMSAVSSINADGLQVILDGYAQYSHSHDILIINPSTDVNKLLILTGLNNLIPIHHRLHEAGVASC